MRNYGRADSVEVFGDEDGFKLSVHSDEGDVFVFSIHHLAEDFFRNVDSQIGSWLRERNAAWATRAQHITEEDLEAYPPGDPKRFTLEREMEKK